MSVRYFKIRELNEKRHEYEVPGIGLQFIPQRRVWTLTIEEVNKNGVLKLNDYEQNLEEVDSYLEFHFNWFKQGKKRFISGIRMLIVSYEHLLDKGVKTRAFSWLANVGLVLGPEITDYFEARHLEILQKYLTNREYVDKNGAWIGKCVELGGLVRHLLESRIAKTKISKTMMAKLLIKHFKSDCSREGVCDPNLFQGYVNEYNDLVF